MLSSEVPQRFAWAVLQSGQTPLQPDGTVRNEIEHRCSVVLVWPAGQVPQTDNTLLIDPCFTENGYAQALIVLDGLGATPEDIGMVFVTHLHPDHMLHFPTQVEAPRFRPFRPVARPQVFTAIHSAAVPGHHPSQEALHFQDDAGRQVWVTGDAVLGRAWLEAWTYFWPNGYAPLQIVETWRSVAQVLSHADVIIPGHDDPLPVTAELLQRLLETFPQAEFASRCPDVPRRLQARLEQLGG